MTGSRLRAYLMSVVLAALAGGLTARADEPDADEDGVADAVDNCPYVANLDQADANRDGVGNVCEVVVSWGFGRRGPLASTEASPGVATPAARGVLLYDVDFGTPPHEVGQPPALGDGPPPRDKPTAIEFGEPWVVDAVGVFSDQPLALDHIGGLGPYEQFRFALGENHGNGGLPQQYPTYHFSMDIMVEFLEPGDQLRVFVDGPTAHSVQFRSSGGISAVVLGNGAYSVPIGTFEFGVPARLAIDVDMVAEEWSIMVDGVHLFTGPYPVNKYPHWEGQFMRNLRPTIPRSSGNLVAMDNVRILDVVEVAVVGLDVKPGSCPNSFNPGSHGILPVALIGTEDFDVTEIDVSSVLLSRADGLAGEVAPHEGPPGPHSVFADVATPFDGEPCDCHELEGDGIVDLSMKFRTDDVVAALELDALEGDVELVVTGTLLDGTGFTSASDCIRLVPPQPPGPGLSFVNVESNVAEAWDALGPDRGRRRIHRLHAGLLRGHRPDPHGRRDVRDQTLQEVAD